MNEITMKMQADQLIRMALQEDITSEDVSTNAVMPQSSVEVTEFFENLWKTRSIYVLYRKSGKAVV